MDHQLLNYVIQMRKYLKEGQYSFDETDVLGKGSFGKVYRAYDHVDSKWVAIKSVDLDTLEKYGDEMKTIICNEITVMRKFTKQMKDKPCPYLVKHEDCFRTDLNIYIVMQLCQDGTLNDLLNKGVLKERQVVKILEHLLLGLEYLDNLSISHRDLKPENIFISSQFNDGQNEIFYKIGDFGFAAQKQTFNEILGTYPFMAPEIYNRQSYTSKVDIWSLGVITYQLLFNELYFFGKNKWQIEKKVKQTPFILSVDRKGKISSEMEQFINLCLLKDQNQRPKASELLKLPLFRPKQLDNTVFDAIDCEIQYCQFLRSMAQETCEFGNKQGRETQFMQIYFLKKAYSIINLLTYSIMNRQNYLNLESDLYEWLIADTNNGKYQQLDGKIQKECILITSIYSSKHEQFSKYITKFSSDEQASINAIIGHENIYNDVPEETYRSQLKKWICVLQGKEGYLQLKMKYEKLYEI